MTSPNTNREHTTRKPIVVDVPPSLYRLWDLEKFLVIPPLILKNMKHDLYFLARPRNFKFDSTNICICYILLFCIPSFLLIVYNLVVFLCRGKHNDGSKVTYWHMQILLAQELVGTSTLTAMKYGDWTNCQEMMVIINNNVLALL